MPQVYAVITADMVNSTRYPTEKTGIWLKELQRILQQDPRLDWTILPEIYRGDSFQGVLSTPQQALLAAILGRVFLKMQQEGKVDLDLRVAIGIGTIEQLTNRAGTSDGTAFRLSGKLADNLKGRKSRIGIATQPIQPLWSPLLDLLEVLVQSWTRAQSEIIFGLLQNKTLTQMSEELGISQPAASQRAQAANWWALEGLLNQFPKLLFQRDHNHD
ncbi:hypothetical protein [Dyadobacter tibetensis]|uniref:hypothetical protein n=1 Tax=Dyadobacter tibetensis TaxID=1211851 RepID=UPI00047000A6|nr:hypothetical protein [Dyadobacter tibetensis]